MFCFWTGIELLALWCPLRYHHLGFVRMGHYHALRVLLRCHEHLNQVLRLDRPIQMSPEESYRFLELHRRQAHHRLVGPVAGVGIGRKRHAGRVSGNVTVSQGFCGTHYAQSISTTHIGYICIACGWSIGSIAAYWRQRNRETRCCADPMTSF